MVFDFDFTTCSSDICGSNPFVQFWLIPPFIVIQHKLTIFQNMVFMNGTAVCYHFFQTVFESLTITAPVIWIFESFLCVGWKSFVFTGVYTWVTESFMFVTKSNPFFTFSCLFCDFKTCGTKSGSTFVLYPHFPVSSSSMSSLYFIQNSSCVIVACDTTSVNDAHSESHL